jgi:hypothetical protein
LHLKNELREYRKVEFRNCLRDLFTPVQHNVDGRM